MPGTPSRHFPLAATSASKRTSRASMGSAPKLLIASMISPFSWRWHTAATSGKGLSTPVPVSQWMRITCVIDASCFSRASSASADTASSSAKTSTLARRPIICVSFAARLQ